MGSRELLALNAALLISVLILVIGYPRKCQCERDWLLFKTQADLAAELDGLTDVTFCDQHLVLSFWGGQKLLVLSTTRGNKQRERNHRWVKTSGAIKPEENLLGGAVARANGGEAFYVSHAEAVYKVPFADSEIEKVAEIGVLGLSRLTCSPSGTLYGVGIPTVPRTTPKLTLWKIAQDETVLRLRYKLPTNFVGAVWIGGILADELGLYVLILHDYRLWLTKYTWEGEPHYAKIVGPYVGNIVDGMRSKVWREGPERLIVHCGDKVYLVNERNLNLQRSTDYADVVLKDDRLESAFIAYDSESASLYVVPDSGDDAGNVFIGFLDVGNRSLGREYERAFQ